MFKQMNWLYWSCLGISFNVCGFSSHRRLLIYGRGKMALSRLQSCSRSYQSICSWPDGSLIAYDWVSQTIRPLRSIHFGSPRLLRYTIRYIVDEPKIELFPQRKIHCITITVECPRDSVCPNADFPIDSFECLSLRPTRGEIRVGL